MHMHSRVKCLVYLSVCLLVCFFFYYFLACSGILASGIIKMAVVNEIVLLFFAQRNLLTQKLIKKLVFKAFSCVVIISTQACLSSLQSCYCGARRGVVADSCSSGDCLCYG